MGGISRSRAAGIVVVPVGTMSIGVTGAPDHSDRTGAGATENSPWGRRTIDLIEIADIALAGSRSHLGPQADRTSLRLPIIKFYSRRASMISGFPSLFFCGR